MRNLNHNEGANHGHVDIGALQLSGTISAAATYGGGAQTLLTLNTVAGLSVNQPIQIAGTTDYDGVFVIRKIVGSAIVIDVAFNVTRVGTFNLQAAVGAFKGFIPMSADLAANSITEITYHDSSAQKGDPKVMAYVVGEYYPFPGIIKKIVLNLGNIRLMRYSSNALDQLALKPTN